MTAFQTRRLFIRPLHRFTPALAWVMLSCLGLAPGAAGRSAIAPEAIDRHALVSRHQPTLTRFDVEAPLSVGNGEFAFTVDVTGLQTFADAYEQTIPLGTLSQWGWHTAPNPHRWSIDTFGFKTFDSHGRAVGYADIPGERTPEINWLRTNPHRLHLGRIGFSLTRGDGSPAAPTDLTDIRQTLDMWNGVITSHFRLDGETVDVETMCHPTLDAVAVRVRSAALAEGRVAIEIRFPYGTGAVTTADWTQPGAHATVFTQVSPDMARFARRLDGDAYTASIRWAPGGALANVGPHAYRLTAAPRATTLSAVVAFAPTALTTPVPAFDAALDAARAHWNRFWSTGGAIDLSGSTDPRWRELERRIVLSQYLTAIQCAGRFPPQETGLTYNSWEGKFHLEMHWWHAAQFALWDRLPLMERSLGYYDAILPKARATAARQGYTGARWPKMTSPTGDESPSNVGPFLVWQQPHPIFYAELVYRARPTRETLDRFRPVVFATAEFMASFPAPDASGSRLVLGPPLQCAQETYPKDRTANCTYELSYWAWGLQTAQAWRERLGLAREPEWDRVLDRLAKPAMADGKYLFAESAPDTYLNPKWATDHPSVLAALGVLPGAGIDRAVMDRTLSWIWAHWDWPTTWGWDYPMVAMTAARLGRPELAIDALLLDTPKNVYRANGHNHQRPGLTIYLPGNGALLYAVAMMAAGWDGAPDRPSPGFPANGRWVVKWEGLRKAP
jgi:protein-glucosylgalactosylhydroxylysine glucosidase